MENLVAIFNISDSVNVLCQTLDSVRWSQFINQRFYPEDKYLDKHNDLHLGTR